MVIITDANGNIQTPTIPENVYQGSNLANEIVFLAPLPQTNVATITFRLPNGVLLEEQLMTPYTSVPSEYNLSAWRFVLNDAITQYYGQVSFQIYVYGSSKPTEIWTIKENPTYIQINSAVDFESNGYYFNALKMDKEDDKQYIKYGSLTVYTEDNGWQDLRYRKVEFTGNIPVAVRNWLAYNGVREQSTIITTVAGTFPVLRGVPRIPHSTPSQDSWNEILTWIATINGKVDNFENGILESKAILKYDATFPYSKDATVYDKDTKAIYTSLKANNGGHDLDETEWWGETRVYSQAEIENFIDAKITTHNQSLTAHSDIRADILANTGRIGDIEDLIPSGTTQANPLVNESQMTTITDALDGRVEDIEELIPAQASPSNQLADKDFVNSSIATNTANFKGTYNIVTDLGLTTSATEQQIATALASEISSADDNDYCFVAYPDATDPTQFTKYDRYKFNGSAWAYEYTLNNSSFTAQQWASINSGITAQKVAEIDDKVDKDQIATKTTAGLVWAWEDGAGFHIWNTDPQQVNYTVEENAQGGLSVVIKTTNYEIEENEQGGLSVIIGGEENE